MKARPSLHPAVQTKRALNNYIIFMATPGRLRYSFKKWYCLTAKAVMV